MALTQILHICIALRRSYRAPVVPAPLPRLHSPVRIIQIFPLAAFWSFHGSRDLLHKSCWPAVGGLVREDRSESDAQKPNLHCFSYGVIFLAKAALADRRLVPNSKFKGLWLRMPALAADFSRIPQPRRGEETESKFREPDSLQWFNMGVSPKYKVLGLCWWMDNWIRLIVCSKTEMLVFTLWHHTCCGAAELWSSEKETWQILDTSASASTI